MDATQWAEHLMEQATIVGEALANNKDAERAFRVLMKEAETQRSDRDARIQRLETDLEIAEAVIQNMGENRNGIIGQAQSDRADLYAAQDRLEQMGENERF